MPQRPILVVDDCRLTRAIVRDMLEAEGFEVVTAASALEVNRWLEQEPGPALVLMDVVMPSLSGDRKTRRLKAQPGRHRLPVVLISTKPAAELQQLAAAAGADGFLQKPLDRGQLVTLIDRLVG